MNKYEKPKENSVCKYITCPITLDGPRQKNLYCNRSSVVTCYLHGLPPIDLCAICYEQMRMESEPHWYEFDWNR